MLLSANALNYDQSKILSFGKELMLNIPYVKGPAYPIIQMIDGHNGFYMDNFSMTYLLNCIYSCFNSLSHNPDF